MRNDQHPWRHYCTGTGRILPLAPDVVRLVVAGSSARVYSDAQLDDYQATSAPPLLHRPPVRLRFRMRCSHPAGQLRGTAGCGLWNYPTRWPPAPPRALWYFYGSAPGNLPLARGVPGYDCWKAASIDLGAGLGWLPSAPILAPLMRVPRFYQTLWPPIQRALRITEQPVGVALDAWHEYQIEWGPRTSRFLVDGRVVMRDVPSPRGPLCFVAWLDNQYLVATPQGHMRWGLLGSAAVQWLELAEVRVE